MQGSAFSFGFTANQGKQPGRRRQGRTARLVRSRRRLSPTPVTNAFCLAKKAPCPSAVAKRFCLSPGNKGRLKSARHRSNLILAAQTLALEQPLFLRVYSRRFIQSKFEYPYMMASQQRLSCFNKILRNRWKQRTFRNLPALSLYTILHFAPAHGKGKSKGREN